MSIFSRLSARSPLISSRRRLGSLRSCSPPSFVTSCLTPPGFALREGTTGGVTDHRAQARDGGRVETEGRGFLPATAPSLPTVLRRPRWSASLPLATLIPSAYRLRPVCDAKTMSETDHQRSGVKGAGMNRPWDNMTLISDPRVNRLQEPPILTLQLCPPSPYGSSG